MKTEEQLVLVDENDNDLGFCEKARTHQEGRLHRAFSIFILNGDNKLLLQKRAERKYHSGGLWSNTCCGHPRPGEKVLDAAKRRLNEEMGVKCPLGELFSLRYRVRFENNIIEHEYDHVLMGSFQGSPKPDPKEACDWKWVDPLWVRRDARDNPRNYTWWFSLLIGRVVKELEL